VTYDVDLAHRQHPGLRPHSVANPKPPRTESRAQTFRVERARYAKAEDAYRIRLQKLVDDYLGRRIGAQELVATVREDMYAFYARMYVLGRRAVGNVSTTLSREEQAWLHGQHSLDMRYFHKFLSDMGNQRGRMPYTQRMDLYGLGGYSAYLMGAIRSLPDWETQRWEWEVNPVAEHCEDCVQRGIESKRKGGFLGKELLVVGLPGMQKCGHRCRCGLRLVGGRRSLLRTRSTQYAQIKGRIV